MKLAIQSSTVIAVVIGFVAGAVTTSLIPGRMVYAQNQKPPAQSVVEAKTFVLLDNAGNKRGEWMIDKSGQPVLRLFDEQGKIVWDTTTRMIPLTR